MNLAFFLFDYYFLSTFSFLISLLFPAPFCINLSFLITFYVSCSSLFYSILVMFLDLLRLFYSVMNNKLIFIIVSDIWFSKSPLHILWNIRHVFFTLLNSSFFFPSDWNEVTIRNHSFTCLIDKMVLRHDLYIFSQILELQGLTDVDRRDIMKNLNIADLSWRFHICFVYIFLSLN